MARTIFMNVERCNELIAFFIDNKTPEAITVQRFFFDALDEDPFLAFCIGMKFCLEDNKAKHGEVIFGVMLGLALARGSNNPKLDELLAHMREGERRHNGENVVSIFSSFKKG